MEHLQIEAYFAESDFREELISFVEMTTDLEPDRAIVIGPFTQEYARDSWMKNLRDGLMKLNADLGINGDGITVKLEVLDRLENLRTPIYRWSPAQALEFIRRTYHDLYSTY